MLKKYAFSVLIFALGIVFVGCGSSRSIRVGDKWEPLYKPKYNYVVEAKTKGSSGYSIGIIQPTFEIRGERGKNAWAFNSPRERQYLEDLAREVNNTLEKILIAKGNKVSGPFARYEEMTYPERERCTFLIQPTFIIDLEKSQSTPSILKEVGGPKLEPFVYAESSGQISGSIQMQYIILDPLTQEKLERHKLNSEEVVIDYKSLLQRYYVKGSPPEFLPLDVYATRYNSALLPYYANYHDPENASAKILELIYRKFMPQMDKLISVDEFNHLKQYQETLREKKRY